MDLLWSLLTFFLGLVVGHRLNLGRERRKERNEFAGPVRQNLIAARTGASTFSISEFDRDRLFSYLNHWDREKLKVALGDILALQPTGPFEATARRTYPEHAPDAEPLDHAFSEAIRILRHR